MEGREGETSAHSPVNIAGGSSVLFAAKLLSSLGFLFTTLLIAKAVGVAGSGAYRFLSVAALIAGQFAQIGLPLVAPLLVARHHGRERDLLTTLVGTSLAFGLGSALLTTVALIVYGTSAVSLAVVAVSAVMIGIGETVQGFGQGLGRFREYSIVTVIAPWLYGLLLAVFWYYDSLTLRVALVLYAVEWVAWALGQLYVASRMTGFGRFDRVLAREAFALGWRALVGSLSLFLNNRVDQILLNLFKGNRAGGIYGLAVNVAEILLYLPRVVGIVLVPAIARTDADNRRTTAVRLFRVILVITAIGGVLALLVGPPLIPFVLPDFRPSVEPFVWLVPGALGFVAMNVFSGALIAEHRPADASYAAIVALAAGVALDLVLIPLYGATGAAVAATLAFFAGGVASIALYRRVAPFPLGELLPRPADFGEVLALARRLRARTT